MLTVNDWREAARRALPRFVYEYVDGAAEDELCLARNRGALDAVLLTPRALRDTRHIDTTISLFGFSDLLYSTTKFKGRCFIDNGLFV